MKVKILFTFNVSNNPSKVYLKFEGGIELTPSWGKIANLLLALQSYPDWELILDILLAFQSPFKKSRKFLIDRVRRTE